MKITKTKSTLEKIVYHLTDEIKYIKHLTNGKETGRLLLYTGKNLHGYGLEPSYDKDLSIFKKTNPFWDNCEWLKNKLPEPEKIEIKKIIYSQRSTHCFFTLKKEPIPVVVHGDYIEAHLNDYFYDLVKLRKHLLKHPNVIECSEILDIPYYNEGGCNGHKYLQVLVYPTKELLKLAYSNKKGAKDFAFYMPYIEDSFDFLKIKKYAIRNTY